MNETTLVVPMGFLTIYRHLEQNVLNLSFLQPK
eukprot:COSAG06_NODE_25622_length_632_cov_1.380863_1_plen_32_part_10